MRPNRHSFESSADFLLLALDYAKTFDILCSPSRYTAMSDF
jgi:hypothetical protein